MNFLAVAEAVLDGVAGGAEVDHGGDALQAVMAGFVEEVAEAGDASGFAGEVHCESSGAAAEHTRNWIQFLTASLQVAAGDDEIAGAGKDSGGEEHGVFAIPETAMAGSFGQRLDLEWFNGGGYRTGGLDGGIPRMQQGHGDLLLRISGYGQTERRKQDCHCVGRRLS